MSESLLTLTKYKGFHPYPQERQPNDLADRVRDVLLEREARCLLDRISYKLELATKYGEVDEDYVNSLRDSEAAIQKLLKFSDGCV